EVVPCLQTLGHLGQVLQWPRFANLKENAEVICPGKEETYAFLKHVIESVAKVFRSRRIHLGMDEAFGLGEKSTPKSVSEIQVFLDHLQRMQEICRQYELKPMIWSDMLFCLASHSSNLAAYYDSSNNPALQFKDSAVFGNVDLVYWDYFHTH